MENPGATIQMLGLLPDSLVDSRYIGYGRGPERSSAGCERTGGGLRVLVVLRYQAPTAERFSLAKQTARRSFIDSGRTLTCFIPMRSVYQRVFIWRPPPIKRRTRSLSRLSSGLRRMACPWPRALALSLKSS